MADEQWQTRLKTGRNEDCPCGSGKKYKKCHLEEDEKAKSVQLAQVNAQSAAQGDPDHKHEGHDHHGPEHAHKHEKGGPMRPHTSTNTSRQISAPRKTGAA